MNKKAMIGGAIALIVAAGAAVGTWLFVKRNKEDESGIDVDVDTDTETAEETVEE